MNLVLREPWTVERFLAWEDAQEGKHEFDGERIIEMTGGTVRHQRITFNLMRALDDRLDPARFAAVPEMRIRAGRAVRYPDVVVVPGPVAGETKTLTDAIVAFEVLSPDTAEADRGRKRIDYAALPALRHYVLVEQDRRAATILTRSAAGWAEEAATDPLALPAIGLALPFAEIWRRLDLP